MAGVAHVPRDVPPALNALCRKHGFVSRGPIDCTYRDKTLARSRRRRPYPGLMRNLALGDVTPDDIRQMRTENETLFVEWKSSLDDEGYKAAEAAAAFANTLGGWIVVGLDDDGNPSGWTPPKNITDRVRQILDRWLDPLPAFAARHFKHEGVPIGLVRIYESTDTPHVINNGKVVVRSVAETRDIYKSVGVDTQVVLRQLAERGRHAIAEADRRLRETPLIQNAIGMEWIDRDHAPVLKSNNIAVRAVPLVGDRLADLAVSTAGRELLAAALRDLAGFDQRAATTLRPAASGLVCEIEPQSALLDGIVPIPRKALAAADAAGVVAVVLRPYERPPATSVPHLTLEDFGKGSWLRCSERRPASWTARSFTAGASSS